MDKHFDLEKSVAVSEKNLSSDNLEIEKLKKEKLKIKDDLLSKEISIISVNDPIDTSNAQGKFAFNIFASLAEFERDLIKMRTKAGLEAALAKGRQGGRPKGLTKKAQEKACAAETLYKEKNFRVNHFLCVSY